MNQCQPSPAGTLQAFRLPRYEEIPNVGLYLEQTAKYINEYLRPIQEAELTGSMISNYVKKHLVANPVKKQYDREQIAYLMFIAVAKAVVSLDNIGKLIALQRESYPPATAYNYFCSALEQALRGVFSPGEALPPLDDAAGEGKVLLRNVVVTVAHKICLDKRFALLNPEPDPE